jgi:hypothetical protein
MTEAEYVDSCLAIIASEWPDACPYSVSLELLQRLATLYGIDIVSEWIPTKELLQTCEIADLQEFADEFEIPAMAREQLIEQLLAKWQPGFVPSLFAIPWPKAKPARKSK